MTNNSHRQIDKHLPDRSIKSLGRQPEVVFEAIAKGNLHQEPAKNEPEIKC